MPETTDIVLKLVNRGEVDLTAFVDISQIDAGSLPKASSLRLFEAPSFADAPLSFPGERSDIPRPSHKTARALRDA